MSPYTPFMLAIHHDLSALLHTLNAIKEISEQFRKARGSGLKTVGIEPPPKRAQTSENYPDALYYWQPLIQTLRQHGIKIVFLTSDKLVDKIIQEAQRAPEEKRLSFTPARQDFLTLAGISTPLDRMVRIDMVREMEQNALREKPELLIVGAAHGAVMRKDLQIPKEKFQVISGPDRRVRKLLVKLMRTEIRAVRRFQRQQRAKKQQPRKK